VVIYVEVEANKEYAEELAANAWKECSQWSCAIISSHSHCLSVYIYIYIYIYTHTHTHTHTHLPGTQLTMYRIRWGQSVKCGRH
jgi:hypothetical protein